MDTAYHDALAYIYGLTDLEKRTDLTTAKAAFGLERVEQLLDRLGHPERRYWTVHIAGTKGKGSTAAMVASILQAAGLRTGLFTSPHLHTFRERMRIDGELIDEAALAQLVSEVRPVAGALPEPPTTFEVATVLAFLYFARQRAEAAVVEVGLGGRLDATNVLLPRVAIITSISYDHMAVLGDTLGQIAAEKAGIIKPDRPVVVAPQIREALDVILQIAQERHAPVTLVGDAVRWTTDAATAAGQRLVISGPGYQHTVEVPLAGAHQATNAAVAVAAVEVLRQQGISMPAGAIRRGLSLVRWPGRLETIAQGPLTVVDGAHNVDSAQKLKQALDQFYPARPRVLLIGVSADKDVAGIMQALAPGSDAVVATRSQNVRAAALDRLQAAAAPHTPVVVPAPGVGEALAEARRLAGPSGLICATGSLFLAAEVRALVFGLPPQE